MQRTLLSLCTLSVLGSLASAQDFERFAPKQVQPNTSKPVQLDVPNQLEEVSNNKDVILPSLNGVTFHLSEDKVSKDALNTGGVVVAEDSIMQQEGFQNLIGEYLGEPLSMHSLNKLTNAIVLYYRSQNVPVVDVVLPEQDITHGVLQVLVIEGRVGEVKVTGNKHFSDDLLRKNVRFESGDRIYSDALIADVNWINNNPFVSARPIFAPGVRPYTTDLILEVDDARPLRYYVGYENSGNELTGSNRYLLGLNWGNAFGVGHQLNYQFTTADDFDELNAHSFSYAVPLQWRHNLSFYGSYVGTSVDTGPFTIDGDSYEAGVRYSVPLTSFEKFDHEVYGGFVWKSAENALEFGVVPAVGTKTEIAQLELGWKGQKRFEKSVNRFDLSVVYSPGDLFGDNGDAEFAASRTGAEANYVYARLEYDFLYQLPKKMTWSSELKAQWSDANLLSSDQLPLGGYSSVRGYDEREFIGADSGVVARNELRFPEISVFKKQDLWQFLLFSDVAWTEAHRGEITRADATTSNSGELWSAGLGARLRVAKNFTLRSDYGFQLKDAGSDRSNGKLHVGGLLTF